MATITIAKKEYKELVEKKYRYEYLRRIIEEDIFATPPTQSIRAVMSSFRATKKYNKKFLESLKRGLMRSSYFRA